MIGNSIRVFQYKKFGEIQKSRQIVKNTGDKGKQIRRFDRFVITRRLAFLNRETRRYKPKLGAEYYFSDIWDTCEHVHR